MIEKPRNWRERLGVQSFEHYHWTGVIGAVFVLASPFFALVRGEAGLLAFAVGLIVFFFAASMAPDND